MAFIFQKLKQNKVSVLAVLLVAAMLVGLLPLGSVTVHAQEIDLAAVTDAVGTAEGTTLKIFGDTELGIEKLYTYKSGAWTPDDGKNYIAKVDDIAALEGKTLQAVSPATASATEFTIPADQSTAENLLSADWCVSGSVPISDRMSFQLSHMLSKVTVVVSEVGEGYEMPTFDGTNNYIRFTSFTDVTYGDTLSKTDEDKTEIKPFLSTTVEGKQAFTAIVYPVSNGESLLSMYLNYGDDDHTDNVFLYTLSKEDMEPGKHYTFNLTIKTNKIELTLESVYPFKEGWSDEVNLDDSEETIGKEDPGKTDWAENDEVQLMVTGGGFGTQTATVTYNADKTWSVPYTFRYLTSNDTITATATYAPGEAGLSEHLQATAEVEGGKVTINFPQTRTYSRLRIASQANKNYSVTVTGFTPAGATESGEHTYTLTTDDNGNAFLYGSWVADSKITVESGGTTIVEETVTSASEADMSYALFVCEHDWNEGVCTVCEATHDHADTDWDNGICTVCEFVCTHEALTYNYKYTWLETEPTSTKSYTCIQCGKAVVEDFSPSDWQVGDKVTYVAKDGNSYVSTVGEVTDGKAVIVSDEQWSTEKITISKEELLAIVEAKGARVPTESEAVWSKIFEPWVYATLPISYGGTADKTISIVYDSGGVLSVVVKKDSYIGIYNTTISDYFRAKNTWVGRYVWDVKFPTAE